jgi:tight adherence protein C
MGSDVTLMVVAFFMATSLAMIAGLVLTGGGTRLNLRIDTLMGRREAGERPETVVQIARNALPKMGKVIVPENEAERTQLRARLLHAGLYNRQAMYVLLGVKFILLILGVTSGIGLMVSGLLPLHLALLVAALLFVIAFIGPSFWLDKRKTNRQTILRRSLPDALDVLVICLEGGLALQSALKRVSGEVRSVHRELAEELLIVDREIQLGRSPGESLWHMAQRTDMEEILGLASVINQSERFGASLSKSLRTHSETLRLKRKQKAEERAQKASTKILVPTLLFIFPAIFVVLLAPAVYQIKAVLGGGG